MTSTDDTQTDAPTEAPTTPPDGVLPITPSGGPASPPDGAAPPDDPSLSGRGDQTAPTGGDHDDDDEPDTFAREYVEQLRRENAAARVKAKRTDTLGQRLVASYAAQTGRLADPTDLAYSDDLCDEHGVPDEAKVAAAVDELLERKPHLASRRPTGDVGQGARPAEAGVSLAGLLRAGAG